MRKRPNAAWEAGSSFICMALASVLVTILLVACGKAGTDTTGRDEVARVPSPDGAFDAVLIETNGGATTSFGYEVEIVRHADTAQAAPIATLYGATRNEQAYGANLRWQGPRELTVEYLQARWVQQRAPSATLGNEEIKINLRSGVADPSAPPGGMAYNRDGRRKSS